VIDSLEYLGLADDTLVICTTDHGIAFPGAKTTLTDRGIGVFLILRGPGELRGGRVIDSLVSHIDLFPTICDLLAIERPQFLQGQSLMPLLRGERETVHDAIFAEGTYHAAYEPQRAVRTDRWKYIRRFDERTTPVVVNTDDSPSKELLLKAGWAEQAVDREQLYDLLFDPNEARNLAGDPAAQAVRRAGRAARAVDGGDRRPAARRPRPAPARCGVQRPGPGLAGRADAYDQARHDSVTPPGGLLGG
jgi:arylsulfatase A-like enzyme